MATSASKGAVRLDEEAMRAWTEKFSEAEKELKQQQKKAQSEPRKENGARR
jgi:hypothetical protein